MLFPVNFSSPKVSPFSIATCFRNSNNYSLLVQKPDEVSFKGKRVFSYTDKGILQNSINECENKDIVNSLLKDDEGIFKYSPFTVFEILTQKDKPNFVENLNALQKFEFKNIQLSPNVISKMLAACDGKDVKTRLDLLTELRKKGIKVPISIFCVNNEKFSKIKPYLEQIDNNNKNNIIATCRGIEKPLGCVSPEERLLIAIFGKVKTSKDDLEKTIDSGKYKNISPKDLMKFKSKYYESYVELYEKSKTMPQILDLIDHIVGLGKHSKYKESWIRKELKDGLKFEEAANIFLQRDFANCTLELELLNKLLLGKQSPELKERIKKFTKKTGIRIQVDSNIPISYIDRFEKMLPSLSKHYIQNFNLVGVNFTNIVKKNVGGYCMNSGITITPSSSDFERIVFHECAHVAHQRCVPYDGNNIANRSEAWDYLKDKNFYPEDSVEYKTTMSQLYDYATTNFVEFVAVLNEKIGTGEFDVVVNDKGEKVLRKYLKDGDTTMTKDLEVLMNIYKTALGPDVGAKKSVNTSLKYVETPFKGTEKFDFIKFMCSRYKKQSENQ